MLRRGSLALVVSLAALAVAASGQEPPPSAPPPTAPPPAQEKPAAGQAAPADPATAKRPKVYDEAADAKQQIAAALAKAKRENQRVLIQWGGNWCPWCLLLHETMTSDPQLAKELLYEYQLIHVDAGSGGDKNVDLASSYGADLKSFGYPFLTILDADGKPVANQETSSLERKGPDGRSIEGKGAGHDAVKVLAFLKQHEAPRLAAAAVLKAGSERAASSGRKLLVHFGAPSCSWCHKLDDWLASGEIAPLVAKDYVELKIDRDRMEGAKAIEDSLGMVEKDGVPWIAIVDPASGKALATSRSETGNIGFPTKDEEIAHFMKMVGSTRSRLTEADLQVLKDSLIRSSKQIHSARQ
jgi:thiol-disulfide isomerase/thioredoxin